MSFQSTISTDPRSTGAGEAGDGNNTIFSANKYQQGLLVGRFAEYDSNGDIIANINGNVEPTVAGVVLRDLSMLADVIAYDTSIYPTIEFLRDGLVQVEVKSGETPEPYSSVAVWNNSDGDAGKAVVYDPHVAQQIKLQAEFIRAVAENVWLIRIYGAEQTYNVV